MGNVARHTHAEMTNFVFFHSPGSKLDRTRAQKAGGAARSRQNPAMSMRGIPDKPVLTPRENFGTTSVQLRERKKGVLVP
jgi:hypothetical protein